MNDESNIPPTAWGRLRDGLQGLLNWPATVMDDPDLDNRRQVYGHVAELLGERLECPVAAARGIVHLLCGEGNETLLAEGSPHESALLEQAGSLLGEVQVQYLLSGSRQAQRVTTITFQADGRLARRGVKEALDWDRLPSEVRSERLRHDLDQVAYRLYPCSDPTL